MRIEPDVKLDFDDVLIRPKRSEVGSRSDVNLIRTFQTLNSGEVMSGVPVIAANLDTTGTFEMARALARHKMFVALHKFYSELQLVEFFKNDPASEFSFYTLGITDKDIEKLKVVSSEVLELHYLCIDAASGYSRFFVERVREIREMFPKSVIIAGNVATPEMVQELLINGKADIVKIGIGPGAHCATRNVTGVGYPQLSAIIESADVAHGLGGHIIADGGCSSSGDICKALGAGADLVMLGTYLSGHDECEGEWEYFSFTENGQPSKKALKVYGMSSEDAMEKHYGGMAQYRASEGKVSWVPYKGSVEKTIHQVLGGIRSACSYIGTDEIKSFSKCTTFVIKKR